ncbi:MAG: Dabb family protein [Clostridia bacterium]|nr:Dabb family protein [Clostridia bacterium]
MVKHMIIWKMSDAIENKTVAKAAIKEALEGLVGVVPGLLEMKILTEGFDCSAGDIMMDSTLESKEALDAYQAHPAHQAVANSIVRPAVCQRLSFDYEV